MPVRFISWSLVKGQRKANLTDLEYGNMQKDEERWDLRESCPLSLKKE